MNGGALSLCVVVTQAEHAAVERAVGWLNDRLAEGGWADHAIRLTTRDSRATCADLTGADIVIHSLLPELEAADEPWASAETRLRAAFSTVVQPGPRHYLCTVFRHVTPDEPRTVLARIRRLNLLATDLSRQTGLFVIDVDRVLADAGSRAYATDYRLRGSFAVEAVARTVAAALLATGFHATLPRPAQQVLETAIDLWHPPRVVPETFGQRPTLRDRGRQGVFFQSREDQAAHVLRQVLQRRLPLREIRVLVAETVRQRGLRASVLASVRGALHLLTAAAVKGSRSVLPATLSGVVTPSRKSPD